MTSTTSTDNRYASRNAYLDQFEISERFEELNDIAYANSNPMARLVIKFVEDAVNADRKITELGQWITERITTVNSKIAQQQHISSLGELQRLPAEYDMACGLRQAAIDNLTHVAAAYRQARSTD
jgi:hypothetical protein